jgi:hypothetical protein
MITLAIIIALALVGRRISNALRAVVSIAAR